jgi:hypothetical protein
MRRRKSLRMLYEVLYGIITIGFTEEEQSEITEKYLDKEFIVKRDDENNYYCDRCRLAYKSASPYVDKKIVLKNIKRNTSSKSSQYPYFAEFEPLAPLSESSEQ